MSEINESPEINEDAELAAEVPVTPVAEAAEITAVEPLVTEVAEVSEVPEAEEVPELVATPVIAEVSEVVEAIEVPVTPFVRVLKETTSKADEDFDWDAFEGTKSVNSTATKKEMTDMYDNTLSILQEKEVVDGRVISMNKREVVVDIGYKSDGIVSVNEFRYNPSLKIGD